MLLLLLAPHLLGAAKHVQGRLVPGFPAPAALGSCCGAAGTRAKLGPAPCPSTPCPDPPRACLACGELVAAPNPSEVPHRLLHRSRAFDFRSLSWPWCF